ncbi:MAG: hypothetical protein DLM67_12855 [Candidatus Nephthysia bennettiae]|uniref:DUF1211 domain-containing protein n=1 Tax=Candidatus Nephthysia bennettiae TaxID=3127016 RepID=A0A934JYE7_9BACT|nr:DUF1211 domain-containing protein [Candidatus Dormibacteraeota bacterium]MBJ7611606.1 DUF1211 domain-containing protein [Candidatus Dormibacteraeota bacterium]PZR94089.1 MAG: hypothetical protein DLM67_12855 [Candidatus Dormibacteraeota bacterium]
MPDRQRDDAPTASAPAPFTERGGEISRLEGFSDCAFAFAITLLVVSLDVPSRFSALLDVLRASPAFALSFAVIAGIWYAQYRFFRRYGMQDSITVLLTLALLFVVLVYVYPLKFVFRLAFNPSPDAIATRDIPLLFTIYGLGFTAVWILLSLLYVNAYRQRHSLGLTAWEAFATRLTAVEHLAVGVFGLLSAALSYLVPEPLTEVVAGFSYFLIFVPQIVLGRFRNRARQRFPAEPAA